MPLDVIQATIPRGLHTILVVDDQPATRYSTARLLRAAGFKTAEASSGNEALDASRSGMSAMVLDVHLPDIDGFEVCRILRNRPETATLPVIHLSAAYIRNEDKVTGLNAGADAYLVHPVEPAVLTATLQALIRARTAEDRLREALEREQAARAVAERLSRTKDDFIAVLSHELRTPLNAIMGWVHVLLRRDPTPEAKRGLESIERNVKTQARIISDILDVSRINSGKLRLDREPVDAAELVLSSLAALNASAAEKQLRVVTEVEPGCGMVWVDPARFQQVCWNLLTNAIKFSQEGGEIRVRLSREGDRLRLSVQDFGQGIAPDFIGRLFDRFSQSDAPSNRLHGGLGLGLSIVKHITDLHGGTVRATSAGLGHGATLDVELPVGEPARETVEAGAPAAASDEPDYDPSALAGRDVLVVEDDPDAREMLSVVLGDRGAHVRTAHDFTSAVDALRTRWPDALVCDIGLPGRDGYELIAQLRTMQADAERHLPAIALTAFARNEDRSRALDAGFDMHLAKPLRPHVLLASLASVLG